MANIETLLADTRYWAEVAAPSTPAAGSVVTYAKSDGLMYSKDDAGVETLMSSGSSGSVATDAIWDAAGDLAVGSGANTAAKLTMGAAGGAVSRVNGAVAWNSGTAFPTAATGDRYWRTDLGGEYYYDGTRWLSTAKYTHPIGTSAGSLPLSASNTIHRTSHPHAGLSAIWVEKVVSPFIVIAGTALSASHKWVGVAGDNISSTSLGTITIDSGASDTWRLSTLTPAASFASSLFEFLVTWTKTGTPGGMYIHPTIVYRLIAT